jgi:hypothetical protein
MQEVEARTCTDNLSGDASSASVYRNCVVTSTADLLAKVIAKVTTEGGCVTGTKTEYCQTQYEPCKKFTSNDPDWIACVDVRSLHLQDAVTCRLSICKLLGTVQGSCRSLTSGLCLLDVVLQHAHVAALCSNARRTHMRRHRHMSRQ